jgi:predicted enzyme related to lactoylglutathione lyase
MDTSAAFCPVVHWEIGTADTETLRRFYGEAFGWKMHVVQPGAYTMIASKGESGLGGGFADTRGGFPDYVTVYVEVDDILAVMDRAPACGGKKLMGPFQASETLTVGFVTDPAETMIGLMHFSGPLAIPPGFLDSPVACPVAGFEIRCRSVARSVAFYRDLFGWPIELAPGDSRSKASAAFPGGPRADFFPLAGEDPHGIRFLVRTPHLAASCDKITRCGGRLLRAQAGPGSGAAALFADPGDHVAGLTEG